MSPNGGIMTRRQFNQKILPVVPPAVGERAKKSTDGKVTNKRFPEIKKFFDDYIQMSDGAYNRRRMSKHCLVSMASISNWKQGAPPGRYSHYHIARYFSDITGVTERKVLADLEAAYNIGWQNWTAQ
jgi:hypothetical protein